jgi:probable F420-dependent oxidoreductase
MRPFRFGLQAPRTTDPDEWLAVARRAERDGYHAFLAPDHVGRLSTFPALMAAAAVTERISIGSWVLNQDFRPPAVLAQEAASVQLLTNGRLELGVGAGWAKHEYIQTGIQFDSGSVRVNRFDEYLQVVKGLLSTREPYSFEGSWFRIQEYQPLPHLERFSPPPIVVGGGSRMVLSVAGRQADIISVATRATPDGLFDVSNMTVEAVENKLRWIRDSAGDRYNQIELNMTIRELHVVDDRRAAASAILERWRAPGSRMARVDELTEDAILASPYFALGTLDEIVAQLEAARERWGFSYIQVEGRDIEAFAPVMARLAGQAVGR